MILLLLALAWAAPLARAERAPVRTVVTDVAVLQRDGTLAGPFDVILSGGTIEALGPLDLEVDAIEARHDIGRAGGACELLAPSRLYAAFTKVLGPLAFAALALLLRVHQNSLASFALTTARARFFAATFA